MRRIEKKERKERERERQTETERKVILKILCNSQNVKNTCLNRIKENIQGKITCAEEGQISSGKGSYITLLLNWYCLLKLKIIRVIHRMVLILMSKNTLI